jgi:hypothetical protein
LFWWASCSRSWDRFSYSVTVQRYLPLSLRESHNTAIGTIYAALYVMYALALAFSLFIVWSEFREAQRTTDHEADAVGDLYQLARQFPEPESLRIQELSRSYARVVAKEEWPLLGGGREGRGSPRAQALGRRTRGDGRALRACHEQTANALQPGDYAGPNPGRQQGTSPARKPPRCTTHSVGSPDSRGVLTVSFGFLFGVRAPWLHRVSITALTVLIVLILYTVHLIEYPFTSDVRVSPAAFESESDRMGDGTNS